MRRSFPGPASAAPLVSRLAAALPSAALLAAALAFGAGLGPAAAAPLADDPPPVTWAVEPAGQAGSDDRAAFAYAVDAGTEIRDWVAISNFAGGTATFSVYATDAVTDFETGAFGLKPQTESATDLGSWITTDVEEITLEVGESAVVPFRILVPSDATPGDHAAGIIASVTVASTDENGQNIALEQRVAARVYVRISGLPIAAVEATGLVAGYTPEWNPFGGGTAAVDFAVTNTGNVRVDVAQDIVVRGPFGIELAVLHADPVPNLLPGQAKHVRVETAGIPPVLLLWGIVTLTPTEPTDTIEESGGERTAIGEEAPPRPEVEYIPVTAETITGAVSWTLLALIVLVLALIWFVIRYISITRERMFDAIDEAEAQARERALREQQEREPVS